MFVLLFFVCDMIKRHVYLLIHIDAEFGLARVQDMLHAHQVAKKKTIFIFFINETNFEK